MNARSGPPAARTAGYERGQRLYCGSCRSEIEILDAGSAGRHDQEFLCCGEPMRPEVGVSVQVDVEG